MSEKMGQWMKPPWDDPDQADYECWPYVGDQFLAASAWMDGDAWAWRYDVLSFDENGCLVDPEGGTSDLTIDQVEFIMRIPPPGKNDLS